MRFQNYILLLFCVFLFACNSKGQLKSGSFVHKDHFTDTASWGIDYAGIMENKVWFLDSLIIFEMKAIYDSTSFNDTGAYRIQNHLFFKYVYFDLKNMKCQDYLSFSDSAQPICNYILPKNSTLFWSFFPVERQYEIKDKYREMSDTILENTVYKRVKRIFQEQGKALEYVYYLDKNSTQTILHLNRDLEDFFPEYSIVRFDAIPLDHFKSKRISEMQLISKGLSEQEIRIFRAWERNSRNTNLPLITYNESFQKCGPNLRYRK